MLQNFRWTTSDGKNVHRVHPNKRPVAILRNARSFCFSVAEFSAKELKSAGQQDSADDGHVQRQTVGSRRRASFSDNVFGQFGTRFCRTEYFEVQADQQSQFRKGALSNINNGDVAKKWSEQKPR